MKMLKSTLAVVTAAAVLGMSGFAQAGATLDAVQKKGFVQCGVSDGLPGFGTGRHRQDPRHRRRCLPRRGRRGIRRRDQSEIQPVECQGAFHRAAIGRDRRTVAQHHLDQLPRFGHGPGVRRRNLLRRHRLFGEQQAGREERQGTGRRDHLHSGRYHHRAERVRLLPWQRPEIHPDHLRHLR